MLDLLNGMQTQWITVLDWIMINFNCNESNRNSQNIRNRFFQAQYQCNQIVGVVLVVLVPEQNSQMALQIEESTSYAFLRCSTLIKLKKTEKCTDYPKIRSYCINRATWCCLFWFWPKKIHGPLWSVAISFAISFNWTTDINNWSNSD